MSYLTELADAIRREVEPHLLPKGDTTQLFRIYAVLALAKGERVTAEDVHNAWVAWMSGVQPDHPSLEPYAELPVDVQAADEPYVAAIRAAVGNASVQR